MIFRLFFALVVSFASLQGEPLNIEVSAETAILINAESGAILFQKHPRKKMYPASVTKIATALYAIKLRGEAFDDVIPAEQECVGSVSEEEKQRSNYSMPSYLLVKDSSHMGIKRGEKLSLKDLMYGMMVASADDASNIIAYTLGNGSIPRFMEGLNSFIKSLGCKDTYFNNPHGLFHPKHVTTAYDLAILAREGLKDPFFKKLVSAKKYTRPKTNKQEPSVLLQTNRLVRSGEFFYPKAIGIKTGYISKAGNTLVAAAKDNERTLIAVLLNVKERKDLFRDSIRLFEAAFNQPRLEKKIIPLGPQKFQFDHPETSLPLKTYIAQDVMLTYYPAEEPKIRAFIKWNEIKLPISKGQQIGELQLKSDQPSFIKIVPLLSQEAVSASNFYKIKHLFSGNLGKIAFWLAVIVICYLLYRLFKA